MLDTIELLTGPLAQKSSVTIRCEHLTIFVGPNNSGKSLALNEIAWIINQSNNPRSLVRNASPRFISSEKMFEIVSDVAVERETQSVPEQRLIIRALSHNSRQSLSKRDLDILATSRDPAIWFKKLLKYMSMQLTGRQRFELLKPIKLNLLKNDSGHMLSRLYHDFDALAKIDELAYDAFSLRVVVDYTNYEAIRVRVSASDIPDMLKQTREFSREAYRLMANLTKLEHASDGVQSYVAILAAIHAGKARVLLLDEPEVFLHPALVRRLGTHVAKTAQERNGTAFVSTHSPDFVMGAIESGVPITVVRLGYRDEAAEVKSITGDRLNALFRNPLARTSHMSATLFTNGAVVTEAEGDRALYEMAYYYIEEHSSKGLSIQFVNARQKQMVGDIVASLRSFGIPAAAVLDLDIVKEREPWKKLLRSAGVPSCMSEPLLNHRNKINKLFVDNNIDMKKDGGVYASSGEDRDSAMYLLDTIKKYGIFVVPGGELESWLQKILTSGGKDQRVVEILEYFRIHTAPEKEELKSDIWAFVSEIVDWIGDPNRKGMRTGD